MTPEQKTFLTSYFIKSEFNHCPLIAMLCLKKALHRLNNIYEKSLRVANFMSKTLLNFRSMPMKSQ